jgi:hypothetical protein
MWAHQATPPASAAMREVVPCRNCIRNQSPRKSAAGTTKKNGKMKIGITARTFACGYQTK